MCRKGLKQRPTFAQLTYIIYLFSFTQQKKQNIRMPKIHHKQENQVEMVQSWWWSHTKEGLIAGLGSLILGIPKIMTASTLTFGNHSQCIFFIPKHCATLTQTQYTVQQNLEITQQPERFINWESKMVWTILEWKIEKPEAVQKQCVCEHYPVTWFGEHDPHGELGGGGSMASSGGFGDHNHLPPGN